MNRRMIFAMAICVTLSAHANAADLAIEAHSAIPGESSRRISVSGQVAVVDGKTLWFPIARVLVRLADIDTCALVQWSFDPKATRVDAPSLAPVPCGALAKAWLKKAVGKRTIRCDMTESGNGFERGGVCKAGSRDLAIEMLRVGWARVSTPVPADPRYLQAQSAALAARYGMWGTYVLDMQEWGEKALDTTLGRRPHADINLLSERGHEISPPFLDARRQPSRRDR